MKTAIAIILFALVISALFFVFSLVLILFNPCDTEQESDEELVDKTPYEEEIYR